MHRRSRVPGSVCPVPNRACAPRSHPGVRAIRWQPLVGSSARIKHKAVRTFAFHEKIQQPMNAIVQVNVQRSGRVSFNELSGAQSQKRVACLIPMFRIGLRLNNPPRSLSPDQFASDQQLRTGDRIGLEERSVDCLFIKRSAFRADDLKSSRAKRKLRSDPFRESPDSERLRCIVTAINQIHSEFFCQGRTCGAVLRR